MSEQGRHYSGAILFKPQVTSAPQVIIDCATIYSEQCSWISQYALLPTTVNPPPIFYSNPGWQFILENLQLNYYAASLPTAPAPDIADNSTQADKLVEANAIARDYKRFELSLLQRESPYGDWHIVGIENIHNYGNIFNYLSLKNPFLSQGDVDIFSPTTQIAIQFREQNISRKIELPTTSDILSIRGSWRTIITL
ncbi:hypothetical protein [Microcoleus sp. B7-D4]|uniref:hypothetical protein n=1 Tax=Microcoleus sp. B7-D4 TaxID=2818696 RepID=UPI002FD5BE57